MVLPVTAELRLGGRFQLEGNAAGTIKRCDPPYGFAATWEYCGEVSWIGLRLSAESPTRTTFELEHTSRMDDERWAEFGPGAVGVGWELGLRGLSLHRTSSKPVDPTEAAAWMGSAQGREFVTLSSRRWGDAHIAAGADPATARSAPDRTTAA